MAFTGVYSNSGPTSIPLCHHSWTCLSAPRSHAIRPPQPTPMKVRHKPTARDECSTLAAGHLMVRPPGAGKQLDCRRCLVGQEEEAASYFHL